MMSHKLRIIIPIKQAHKLRTTIPIKQAIVNYLRIVLHRVTRVLVIAVGGTGVSKVVGKATEDKDMEVKGVKVKDIEGKDVEEEDR
jgi:hypothetical protein